MNRDGKSIEQVGPEDYYGSFRLSPDGKRVALNRGIGADDDVWTYEFGRAVMTRLTFDEKGSIEPVWSPDGRQVAFLNRTNQQLYRKDAGGEGKDEQLTRNPSNKVIDDWSPDGRYLLFYETNSTGASDLSVLPLEGARKPFVILNPLAMGSWPPSFPRMANGSHMNRTNQDGTRFTSARSPGSAHLQQAGGKYRTEVVFCRDGGGMGRSCSTSPARAGLGLS